MQELKTLKSYLLMNQLVNPCVSCSNLWKQIEHIDYEDDWWWIRSSKAHGSVRFTNCHGRVMLVTVGIVHVSCFNLPKQSSKCTCRWRINKALAKKFVNSWWTMKKKFMWKMEKDERICEIFGLDLKNDYSPLAILLELSSYTCP